MSVRNGKRPFLREIAEPMSVIIWKDLIRNENGVPTGHSFARRFIFLYNNPINWYYHETKDLYL
jgi:hypothetical protein